MSFTVAIIFFPRCISFGEKCEPSVTRWDISSSVETIQSSGIFPISVCLWINLTSDRITNTLQILLYFFFKIFPFFHLFCKFSSDSLHFLFKFFFVFLFFLGANVPSRRQDVVLFFDFIEFCSLTESSDICILQFLPVDEFTSPSV